MTATTEHADPPPPGGETAPTPTPAPGSALALARLVAIVVGIVLLAWWRDWLVPLGVIGALVLMVMLHELGHFVAAKLGGMKVTEFYFGFGPRLWSVRKGETEYGFKAIPAGGYVRIIGMHNLEKVDPADEPRSYRQQSFPRRLAVAVAGSSMHVVIAFLLLVSLFAGAGRIVGVKPVVSEVLELSDGSSPARAAGLREGDRIISIDGRTISDWDQVPELIRGSGGRTLAVVVRRDGQERTLTMTPRNDGTDRTPVWRVGIVPADVVHREALPTAVGRSAGEVVDLVPRTIRALGSFFAPDHLKDYTDKVFETGRRTTPTIDAEDGNRLLSPVGAVRVASDAARIDVRYLLLMLVEINLFVAVFNMVPLLPLDGGHVAIAVYERIRSRKGRRYHADIAKLMPVAYAVVMLMVFLGVSALYLDLVNPISLR